MDEFSGNKLNVLLERLDLKALLNDMEDKTLSTLSICANRKAFLHVL